MGNVVSKALQPEITCASRKREPRIDNGGEGIGAIRKNADADEDEHKKEAEQERRRHEGDDDVACGQAELLSVNKK